MTDHQQGFISAASPFDLRSADAKIHTGDNVEFRVHKAILAIASPWFNSTLSVDQSHADDPTAVMEPIPISEDSATFDALMRLVYPVKDPCLEDNLSLVENVLDAATKYEMEEAVELTRAALRKYIDAHPLQVFRIACRLHIEEEAQLAAARLKDRNPSRRTPESMGPTSFESDTLEGSIYVPEMADMSAGAYFRLLYFLRTNPSPSITFTRQADPAASADAQSDQDESAHDAEDSDAHLFVGADVLLRSYDGVEVPVHRLILRLAGAEQLLAGEPLTDSEGRHVYDVNADGKTLRVLVRLCYPFGTLPDGVLGNVGAVMRAADLFGIVKAKEIVRKYCGQLIRDHPLLVYFLAVKWEWKEEISLACKLVAELGVKDHYTKAMEGASTHCYVQLLKYCHGYVTAVSDAVLGFNPSSHQWKRVVDKDTGVPPKVYLPLVEQESQSHFCWSCMQSHNSRTACNCRSGEFMRLVEKSISLEDAIQRQLSKINIDLPALRLDGDAHGSA